MNLLNDETENSLQNGMLHACFSFSQINSSTTHLKNCIALMILFGAHILEKKSLIGSIHVLNVINL